jgi:hypothetical protein
MTGSGIARSRSVPLRRVSGSCRSSASYLGTPRLTGFVLGYGGTAVTEMPGAVAGLRRLLDAN